MSFTRLPILLTLAISCAWSGFAQTRIAPTADNELVKGSRRAIIETGISETYFDTHFRLASVFDRPGDQRVVWQLRVNGYVAIVNDAIGFYTDARGKRVYTHSIANTLGRTRDIAKTISKTKSAALMKSCLGRYTATAVVLMRFSPGEVASLYLIAHSRERPADREKEREREREADQQRKQGNPQVDQPESEGSDQHPTPRIGYINLETGKCSKGLAIVTP